MKLPRLLLTLVVGAFCAASVAFAQSEPLDPVAPPVPDLRTADPAIKPLVEAFRTEQQALRAELRADIAAIEDPTREAIQAATAAFREENAERIAAQRELAEEIRTAIREARGDRERPAVSPEVAALLAEFRTTQQTMRQAQRDLREQLAAVGANREEILRNHRESQRELYRQLKDIQRQLRDSRGQAAGNSRR